MADYDTNALSLLISKQYEKHMLDIYKLKAAASKDATWLLPQIVAVEQETARWLFDYAKSTKVFYTDGSKLQATAYFLELNNLIMRRAALWKKWSNVTGKPVPKASQIDAVSSIGSEIFEVGSAAGKIAKVILALLLLSIAVPIVRGLL